ncbi:heparan-alpha-glucosaminide N-acetyltransferase domain-containing protein [Dyadobacter chenwenxiniae]|uniref:Heparan-alpha-glucosaminide N-acetyltransferase domain-containing protein n=1 Tax=Dyadobacter chenwenxiniae TaxID=2906456 RepID=A0A9X1PKA8_9BACT|nr:heparan-alpha-glucosaminide N-acetyltransferase domain-containing protein [Dyadobacter chenwenxiniae]MCF0061774.1 heparan-alpha-glucosaminide N-acetyltransferase domain-containing protein [Dyadobacter chenwenxiniae]UON81591.1 heparan-alpha-glucosaminide N-acetyltransferase domain-containing protein [Dyadobacter chenwenxiniae]
MSTISKSAYPINNQEPLALKSKRIYAIDLLRGIVMIVMALDHVRDYFHVDAFFYSPTDLTQTNVALFFTRLITHFCAPIFIFLAGISACLYGAKRSRKQLSFFLLIRGIWLILAECFIVTFEWTFNPSYPYFNLAVIWVTGVSMVFMSAIIYLNKKVISVVGILLIAGHNLLDNVNVPGGGFGSFLWALIHEPGYFTFGNFSFSVRYALLPWLGIMATGYAVGNLYLSNYHSAKRRATFIYVGLGAMVLFVILRCNNWYGDAAHWSLQKSGLLSLLSFLNVSKYPPSLLYALMTLGPALTFLALIEKPSGKWSSVVSVFGRVPMFYYLAHLYLIHMMAMGAAVLSGYEWADMILTTSVNNAIALKGYGFNLPIVYIIWIAVVLILYPICKKFDQYKRANQSTKWWLSYW